MSRTLSTSHATSDNQYCGHELCKKIKVKVEILDADLW